MEEQGPQVPMQAPLEEPVKEQQLLEETAVMVFSQTSMALLRTMVVVGVGAAAKVMPTAQEAWEEEAAEVVKIRVAPKSRMLHQTQVVVGVQVGRGLVQVGRASSSYATSPPPAATKAAPQTTTTTGQTAPRARPARQGCPTRLTSVYARKTTTAGLTAACTRAPLALMVPPDPQETPSRVATRRRARLDLRYCSQRRRHRRRHRRHRRFPPPKTRRRRLRRHATRSSPTSPTQD